MKRIFIAIDISDVARRGIVSHIESLRRQFPGLRVGWEKEEKLHLTLKFLGDINNGRLEALERVLEIAARRVSEFDLTLRDPGVFPSKQNARVLWIGVDDPRGRVTDLYEILEDECEKIGVTRETRDFKPHLTVARLREAQRSRQLVEKHLQTEFEPVEFSVPEIVIYESRLHSTGSVYTPVSSRRLKN